MIALTGFALAFLGLAVTLVVTGALASGRPTAAPAPSRSDSPAVLHVVVPRL